MHANQTIDITPYSTLVDFTVDHSEEKLYFRLFSFIRWRITYLKPFSAKEPLPVTFERIKKRWA